MGESKCDSGTAFDQYSYELRTLIFSIVGLSRLLSEDLEQQLPQDLGAGLAGLVRAGEEVVDQLSPKRTTARATELNIRLRQED